MTDPYDSLRSDMNRGFDDVKKAIGELVTQGEFKATVLRLDMRHNVADEQIKNLQMQAQQREVEADTDAEKAHKQIREELAESVDNVSARVNDLVGGWWKTASLIGGVIGTIVAVAGVLVDWYQATH